MIFSCFQILQNLFCLEKLGVYNKCPSHHLSAPGQVELEKDMLRWTADLYGYDQNMLGVFTSGGSMANLLAIITARDTFITKKKDLTKSVIYLTRQVHGCVVKAFRIAGLEFFSTIRFVDTDNYRMDTKALKHMIVEDIKSGLEPMLVIGTAGTTDTGTIDPLEEIGEICQKFGIWFHCDGAYGGFFILVDQMKERLKGMGMADSIALDPHKTLFTTFGCSMILVKNGEYLARSFHINSSYFEYDCSNDEHGLNPSDLSLEMSRPFRGIKIWLPLMIHGLDPFKASLEEKLLLTRYFHDEVQKIGFEVGPDPDLSVCIHRFPHAYAANEFNQELMDYIRNDGRVYISSTIMDGVFWIRIAILQFRTHFETVENYLSLLKRQTALNRHG